MAFVKFNPNNFRPDPKPDPKPKKAPVKIKEQSEKRKTEDVVYKKNRKIFLSKQENLRCFVESCKMIANTIEHTKGRQGFADDWARENKISLLLDERFWEPCCNKHNLEFENNTELSNKYQLSKIHEGKKI